MEDRYPSIRRVRDMDDCTKERFATLIMEVMAMDEEEYECYKCIMEIQNNVLVRNFFHYTDYVRIQKRGR